MTFWFFVLFPVVCMVVCIVVCIVLRLSIKPKCIAFFHPWAAGGGGGERVLWLAVATVRKHWPEWTIVIYAGGHSSSSSLCKQANEKFGVVLKKDDFHVVPLIARPLVESHRYPVLTMIGQAIGSMLLALEAVFRVVPEIVVDTTGFAFIFPVFRLAGSAVGCYVHYPTISTDMLAAVRDARPNTVHSSSSEQRSPLRRKLKLAYYHAYAKLYGWVGMCANRGVLCNSSWTAGHIRALWGPPVDIVFPPCDTTRLEKLSLAPQARAKDMRVLSVAQFRPEKDHALQIRAFARVLDHLPGARLVLLGGVRNDGDAERVSALEELAAELNVAHRVEFVVNASLEVLDKELGRASVGLHTMWNEHFGIGVVELMAAGVITVAHNSGGPKADIVHPGKSGFLAETEDEYADCILAALQMNEAERRSMQIAARAQAKQFSDEQFERRWVETMRL